MCMIIRTPVNLLGFSVLKVNFRWHRQETIICGLKRRDHWKPSARQTAGIRLLIVDETRKEAVNGTAKSNGFIVNETLV